MAKESKKYFNLGLVLLILFVVFTFLVKTIDVKPVGPEGSLVGFAGLNTYIFELFGQNPIWYSITNILGLIAVSIGGLFGLIGLIQLIKRKSIKRVDKDIILLGIFYFIVIGFYILFEVLIINYRPILMEGKLEASYPSSHSLIVFFILSSGIIEFKARIGDESLGKKIGIVLGIMIGVTLVGRLVSGVHWFTDIIGGVLLATSLFFLYLGAYKKLENK